MALWYKVSICIQSGVNVTAPPRSGQRIEPSKLVNTATARLLSILAYVYFSLSKGRVKNLKEYNDSEKIGPSSSTPRVTLETGILRRGIGQCGEGQTRHAPWSTRLSPIRRWATRQAIFRWDKCLESGFFAVARRAGVLPLNRRGLSPRRCAGSDRNIMLCAQVRLWFFEEKTTSSTDFTIFSYGKGLYMYMYLQCTCTCRYMYMYMYM